MIREHTVLLVAPYDRYASIDRFVACLERELSPHTDIRTFRPVPIFARFSTGVAKKWAAYIDKLIVAPRQLARQMQHSDVVHLTDTSLAIYTKLLVDRPHLLNCHDLIAVRSALGELPEYRPGRAGQQLQKRILRGLKTARHVVTLADCTKDNLLRLTDLPSSAVSVIPVGLHDNFRRVPEGEATRVTTSLIPDAPFLLHVGGNQWYKNRKGLLEIYIALQRIHPHCPNLVLIGEALTPELTRLLSANGVSDRVFTLTDISNADLFAFYSRAKALLFPSFYEGFGWPIIEAQACECPVITTDRAPMNQVVGSGAILLPPNDVSAAARQVRDFLLESNSAMAARVAAGRANILRFSTKRMIETYLSLYAQLSRLRTTTQIAEPALA